MRLQVDGRYDTGQVDAELWMQHIRCHAVHHAMHLQGAKPLPLLLSCAIGAALRFLVPIPEGITVQAWTLLSIFVSTITGTSFGSIVQHT